jgi:hypothetical protein
MFQVSFRPVQMAAARSVALTQLMLMTEPQDATKLQDKMSR